MHLQWEVTALFFVIGVTAIVGFHVQQPLSRVVRPSSTTLSPRFLSEEDTQVDPQGATGEDGQVNGASLVVQNDQRTTLASAFSALAENDQYDAVLTGLCAKILDDTEEEKVISSLQDPVSLMREMNDRRVEASGRSLMALIDVSDDELMHFAAHS